MCGFALQFNQLNALSKTKWAIMSNEGSTMFGWTFIPMEDHRKPNLTYATGKLQAGPSQELLNRIGHNIHKNFWMCPKQVWNMEPSDTSRTPRKLHLQACANNVVHYSQKSLCNTEGLTTFIHKVTNRAGCSGSALLKQNPTKAHHEIVKQRELHHRTEQLIVRLWQIVMQHTGRAGSCKFVVALCDVSESAHALSNPYFPGQPSRRILPVWLISEAMPAPGVQITCASQPSSRILPP